MSLIHITEEMLSVGQPIAQGEVLIWSAKYAPKAIRERVAELKMSDMPLENGMLILGHSETGHHHVLEPVNKSVPISRAAQALIDATNDTLIELKLSEPCALVHMRGHDTHQGFVLPPGQYIRGIREEQFPEGWRQTRD